MPEVAVVRNCLIPLDLYYQVEELIWVRPADDGSVTLGLTDVAQTTAGRVLAVTFRSVGRTYERGRPVAVLESGKWLGPLRTPVTGTLVAVNDALRADPGLVNRSPYTRGWVVRMQPAAWQEESPALVTGQAAVEAYEGFMLRRGLDDCVHCDGFEV